MGYGDRHEQDMARLRFNVRLLTWMIGGIYPLMIAVAVGVFLWR